ncbi:coil containing protein [Vibrio phage 1.029.O._10N.261.55.A7]|nr:coil containing protein [Vibrio phage 1.029.O._10N.261.55.A7]
MMKYCVALINFFDNDLKQFIVEADNWQEALIKAEQENLEPNILCEDQVNLILSFDGVEDGKEMYFDQDQLFSIKELED